MAEQTNVSLGWSRRKRFAVKLILVAASLLVGLACAEVVLRVAGFSFNTFYATDPDLGYALDPGVEGWFREEGESYLRINSDGLRDREHAKQKPPNTYRVAIIGDSYAEAKQVQLESAFWHLMEERLRSCHALAGRDVEVINFGVSGYGTAQELLTLRKKVWAYSPDLVLLTFTTNNDVTDNSRALRKSDDVPYFYYRDGALTLDDSFRTTRAYRWRQTALSRAGTWIDRHCRVWQAVHEAQYLVKQSITRWRARRDAAARRPVAMLQSGLLAQPATGPTPTDEELRARAGELGLDNLVYREPLDDTWREAWRVTEGLITRMRDEVEAHGARFAVATLSVGIQVVPDPNARAAFMRRVGATDLFYVDHRVAALGAREHFQVFTLAPEMQAYADERKVFLHGFAGDLGNGHWNAEGHRVAGELLSEKLCDWLQGNDGRGTMK